MSNATLSPAFDSLGSVLGRSWWLVLLRGVAAILFGVATFAAPGISLYALVLLYGAYAIVDGGAALVAAFRGGTAGDRWWPAIGGVVSIAAGAAAFAWPGLTAVTFVILIGAWSVVRGLIEIGGGIALRKQIDNVWLPILGGLVSVLFGIAILVAPGAGALAILWMIGTWAIIFGGLLVLLAFQLQRLPH